MQQVKKKKQIFSRYLRRDRKWITFLSERKFSEKKKVECPLADQLSSSPLTKRAPRKRERAKVKKKKKGQGQHLKQDPPLCLEGSPFLENDGIKKEKKRPPNMEREEMSVSSFIRQNNRRGQVSERSLPRTISLLLLLLLVINPIIRDMRTTRQRER